METLSTAAEPWSIGAADTDAAVPAMEVGADPVAAAEEPDTAADIADTVSAIAFLWSSSSSFAA